MLRSSTKLRATPTSCRSLSTKWLQKVYQVWALIRTLRMASKLVLPNTKPLSINLICTHLTRKSFSLCPSIWPRGPKPPSQGWVRLRCRSSKSSLARTGTRMLVLELIPRPRSLSLTMKSTWIRICSKTWTLAPLSSKTSSDSLISLARPNMRLSRRKRSSLENSKLLWPPWTNRRNVL